VLLVRVRDCGDTLIAAYGERALRTARGALRELRSDAAYVAAGLRSIAGLIVMVGHDYGGAVISNTATGNDQVRAPALVYINGWVLDEGESLIELADLNEGSLIGESLQLLRYRSADGRMSWTCTSTKRGSGPFSPARLTPRPPRTWRWRSARRDDLLTSTSLAPGRLGRGRALAGR
jgi:pimeloyl-ACP methyl ester carboxylesterase